MTSHIALNVGPLRVWAKGNLFLLLYTYFASYMTLFCSLLLVGAPGYMMAPKGSRMTIFFVALLQVVFWYANVIGLVYNYFKGGDSSNTGTILNLVQIYIVIE